MLAVPAATPLTANVADFAPLLMVTDAGTVAMFVWFDERVTVVDDVTLLLAVTVTLEVLPTCTFTFDDSESESGAT